MKFLIKLNNLLNHFKLKLSTFIFKNTKSPISAHLIMPLIEVRREQYQYWYKSELRQKCLKTFYTPLNKGK